MDFDFSKLEADSIALPTPELGTVLPSVGIDGAFKFAGELPMDGAVPWWLDLDEGER